MHKNATKPSLKHWRSQKKKLFWEYQPQLQLSDILHQKLEKCKLINKTTCINRKSVVERIFYENR